MCILEFVAENHKKVVATYNYLIDNESKWYNKPKTKNSKPDISKADEIEKKYRVEEESTEEDSDDEWI